MRVEMMKKRTQQIQPFSYTTFPKAQGKKNNDGALSYETHQYFQEFYNQYQNVMHTSVEMAKKKYHLSQSEA